MTSMDKAMEAAALAILPKFTGFLKGDMPKAVADEVARLAIEAAAPLIRAEVEREVVEWLRGKCGDIGDDFADDIERGDYRKTA